MPSYFIPDQTSIVDVIVSAIKDLLTVKLIDEVHEYDATRAVLIKAGPRQDDPESVTIMIHENHPDSPDQWPHAPKTFRSIHDSGGMVGDKYTEVERLRVTAGRVMMGGGSQYTRAFTIEIEIFGMYVPDLDVDRDMVRQIAALVENRATKALLEAGPKIGTNALIRDSFGEYVVEGPFLGNSWTDPEQGESLIVRKYIQIWYRTSKSWSTSEW
jgi:hypothetical protein